MPIATSSDKIDLSSENQTEEFANRILKKLKTGDVVFPTPISPYKYIISPPVK